MFGVDEKLVSFFPDKGQKSSRIKQLFCIYKEICVTKL